MALNDVTADARWHQWLSLPDPATGRVRQQLYADAIERGDHIRARMFVEQFEQARATGMLSFGSYRRQYAPRDNKPFYTRPQIRNYYEQHRRGELTGAAWDQLERDILRASAEGRIANPAPLAKNFGDGR
jgi:hypothetical protein